MKDELVGRVVGYSIFHKRVPVDNRHPDGPKRIVNRTLWGRVIGDHRSEPSLVIVQNIHTGVSGIVGRSQIHTAMPETY